MERIVKITIEMSDDLGNSGQGYGKVSLADIEEVICYFEGVDAITALVPSILGVAERLYNKSREGGRANGRG